MTSDEKNAILQFIGVTYGHSHKLDKDIVGESQFVKPISSTVRQTFEEILKTKDTPNETPQSQPEYIHQPTQQEITSIPEQFKPQVVSNQHTASPEHITDRSIVNQLETINLHLQRIGDILEVTTNYFNARPKKKVKDIIQK